VIDDVRRRKLARLLITCRAFGINRDDRLALANTLLYRPPEQPPIQSFNDLTDSELDRMLDAMEGAALVAHLVTERRAGTRPAWARRAPKPSPLGGQAQSG
jgi:hypothetical protein